MAFIICMIKFLETLQLHAHFKSDKLHLLEYARDYYEII